MAKRKLKLFLLVISGLFIFGIGYIFAQKYQNSATGQLASVFPSQLDSDNDGLTDAKEKELGANPYLADSDSDGFTDKQEIDSKHDPNIAESNNLIDQDADGLIGLDEKKYGTDPNKSDTDLDGYFDGEEIAEGFDPLKADLSNIKTILNAIPKEKKDEAKDITGVNLTSSESVDALQNILNSENADELQKYADQFVAGADQELKLPEISDSEIKISEESANSENLTNYLSQFNNIAKQNLDFLIDQNKQEQMISQYKAAEAALKISQGYSKASEELKQIEIPNNSEIISVHKQSVSIFITLAQKYDILANSQNSNAPTLTQALKDILALNKMLSQDAFIKIKEIAAKY